ncbi:hypothetical protein QAD02_008155 [Eretmocerus hayati]|uniref:Uncharacterized protein n=1 Tax=Eretmocerus hayati TaxID=131215 RepID=A0ACC2N6B2_9HYME|nr:hypothetical protein QAD02_008155 [Eretmocerus hayati]
MHNARYILKDLLNKRSQRLRVEIVEKVVGKQRSHQLNPGELEALLNSSLYHDGILDNHEAKIYGKAKRGKEEFTSSIYKRQKKRLNSMVGWNRGENFGSIRFFLLVNEQIYTVIRKFIRGSDSSNVIAVGSRPLDYFIPIRPTHFYEVLPFNQIEQKLLRVNNYICTPPNLLEKK